MIKIKREKTRTNKNKQEQTRTNMIAIGFQGTPCANVLPHAQLDRNFCDRVQELVH